MHATSPTMKYLEYDNIIIRQTYKFKPWYNEQATRDIVYKRRNTDRVNTELEIIIGLIKLSSTFFYIKDLYRGNPHPFFLTYP